MRKNWIGRGAILIRSVAGSKQTLIKTVVMWKERREEMQERIQGWNQFSWIIYCGGWGTVWNNSMINYIW